MTITYATGVGGYSARRFACTHNDPLCSYSAVVVVLEDGRWYGDALCADHAPTSALRSLAAAEAGKGDPPPPPAATEGQGAVSASPAPAPGGPTEVAGELRDHAMQRFTSSRAVIAAYTAADLIEAQARRIACLESAVACALADLPDQAYDAEAILQSAVEA